MTEEEIRAEIEREIAQIRPIGPGARGYFQFADSRLGSCVLGERLVWNEDGKSVSIRLDRWDVSLYAPGIRLYDVGGLIGKPPEPERTLRFYGDAALVEWYVKEGPHAKEQPNGE